MSPERKLEELGGVVDKTGAYRAHIHILEVALSRNIYGPHTAHAARASYRPSTTYSAFAQQLPTHTSRAEGLQAMKQAAERLKDAAAS